MTNSNDHRAEVQLDRYGLKIAARLSAGAAELPHDISERLRAARVQAVSKRKIHRLVGAPHLAYVGAAAMLGNGGEEGEEGLNWWNRIASVLPLLALAFGLVTINAIQNDNVANEIAVVDAALLVDDLPPAAYADPGFAQFIKVGNSEAQ